MYLQFTYLGHQHLPPVSREERDRHISRTLTRPETTVAPGWEQYPLAYVVRPTLTSAR